MGSRAGGGLQGLLEHAAREYEKVDTEERGPEEGSEETGAVALLTPRSDRPDAGGPKSSGSADPEEQSADRKASNGGDGSDSRDAGTTSRKRQRVDSRPLGVSPSPSRGLNSHFSEDGGASGGESYGGDAGADAGKDGTEGGRGHQTSAASVELLCQYEGCSKDARSGGRKFCRRHGEGRRCKAPGCNKVDVGGGNCRKHGGGRRCGADGCMKTDVGGGFCVSHGGGKRCQSEGCAKGAQAGGVFCKSHGGGRRCRIEGCMTSAQSGADVLCIKHGGGKRCMVAGCKKLVRKNNRCTKHASEASNIVAASPPPVPASAAMNAAKTKAAVAATAAVLTATTAAAPVAPPPAPRRRPAPPPPPPPSPSLPRIAEPGALSPPEQFEAPARGNGGRLPSVSSMAREPSPNFGPGTGAGGPLLGSLSSFRPPVAAFGDRVSAGAPMHCVTGWVPDGVRTHSSGHGFSSHSNDARFLRAPLPGIGSIGSSLLGADQRVETREGPMSVGQLAPPDSPSAAPLLLTEAGGLPRHLLPGGRSTGARDSRRTDIANNNLLPRPRQDMAGGTPSSTRGGLPADHHRPLPYGTGRFSDEGGVDRSPSLSPLPSSLLLQQPPPPPFPPSYLPAGSASSWYTGAEKRAFAWPADTTDTGGGSRPAGRCDDLGGGAPPNASNSSSFEAGELASAAELSRPPAAGATTRSSAGAMLAGNPGEASASGGTVSSSPQGGVALQVLSEPAAASQRMDPAAHLMPMPAAERPSRPSGGCCGGEIGGSKASQGSTAAGVATSSCSTSPPLEQTSSFVSLNVADMKCMENCGQTVQRALREIPGVQSVTIHFPTRTASVKVDTAASVSPADLTAAVEAVGFTATCIASTTTEEPTLEQDGVNAVWAIASALGLVDRGCAMAWGDPCSCGDECQCVNCPQHGKHIKEVSHAVDLVLKAANLSSSTKTPPPPKQPQPPPPQQQQPQQQDLSV